jgi:hypothetical protein
MESEAAPKKVAPKAPVKQSPKIAAMKQQTINTSAVNN